MSAFHNHTVVHTPLDGTVLGTLFTNIPNLVIIASTILGVLVDIASIGLSKLTGHTVTAQSRRDDDGAASGGNPFLKDIYSRIKSLPMFDWEECLLRAVCEANSDPLRYGALGVPFQLFFPPYSDTDDPAMISKYQLAARYGKSPTGICDVEYGTCMMNPLDLLTNVANWFKRAKG